jgi:L-threonylcarbamoyladenylate synthase
MAVLRSAAKIGKAATGAAAALAAGELVAFPTETVYGLGADATNPDAVARIFHAKGRPPDHPLIVHVAGDAKLDDYASEVPEAARKLAASFWPGPLTLILKKSAHIPDIVTGGQDTVGLRCPSHPVAQKLLGEFSRAGSGAIAAPSANRFGHVSPTTAQHVRDEFGEAIGRGAGKILLLDGGACEVGIESTILDLSGMSDAGKPVLLRPGAITREQIAEVIGERPLAREKAGSRTPRASGTLDAHYAPQTPLRLVSGKELKPQVDALLSSGRRVAVLAFDKLPDLPVSPPGVGVRAARPVVWITGPRDAAAYARDLYASLRTLDAAGTSQILIQAPPQTSGWDAVNDRLKRAAAGAGTRAEKR